MSLPVFDKIQEIKEAAIFDWQLHKISVFLVTDWILCVQLGTWFKRTTITMCITIDRLQNKPIRNHFFLFFLWRDGWGLINNLEIMKVQKKKKKWILAHWIDFDGGRNFVSEILEACSSSHSKEEGNPNIFFAASQRFYRIW